MSDLRWFLPMVSEPREPEEYFGSLPLLRTSRLTLRPVKMSDASDMFAYSRDAEVARHVLWNPHRTIADTRGCIRSMLRQYREHAPSSYAIILNETGHMIGTIGFMTYDSQTRCAEVGYSIARPFWGQGLMTEALQAVLAFSFERMRLHRVEGMHDTRNPASGRVMEKCGMQKEGLLRQKVLNKGSYIDTVLYAILKKDWEAVRRKGIISSAPPSGV